MGYKLFPYERRLGVRELEGLGFQELSDEDGYLAGVGDSALAIQRATYFETVENGHAEENLTQQAAVELEHLTKRNGAGRQATRYGLHGMHEYKGKFNPQVVRAFCNVADLDAEVLIDPFCGSGTSLVEGLRLGMDVVGIDHSPIAHFIAEAKLRATTAQSKSALAEEVLQLGGRVAAALKKGQETEHPASRSTGLTDAGQTYLEHWLTAPVYAGVSRALAVLHQEGNSLSRQLGLVALSSILRQVSLQLPEDLRIRRRPEPFDAPPAAPLFTDAINGIHQGLLEMDNWDPMAGRWTLSLASAEDGLAYSAAEGIRRRLIVTSPPYATALPYIDTDRLSLIALGLTDATDLTALGQSLIGSREWTSAQRREWDMRRELNMDHLPDAISSLVSDIHQLNSASDAGFRRQAVPSLLYRYFVRMDLTIDSWRKVLAPGERAVVIVGNNHTTAGNTRIDIPTPALLGEIAERRGFIVSEIFRMETWPRYGLHAANGIPGEDALLLQRLS